MNFPEELYYTKDHEWAKPVSNVTLNGNGNGNVVIGITDHAQNSLGDIVFVELPEIGRELKSKETFGVVESIKAVSDLYSPLSGKVLEVNNAAVANPATINTEPYTTWLIKLELSDKNALNDLMRAPAYKTYVESLK